VRTIELDAGPWKTRKDFLSALRLALGAPYEHGWSLNAFVDSMVYGGMNSAEPPYTIQVLEAANVPKEVRDHIALLASDLQTARAERKIRMGTDVEVSIKF
jgi:hypothetical protein